MSEYQQHRVYKKIPKSAKLFIDDFAKTGDRDKLFENIRNDVESKHKDTAKYIRQSEYRSLLRNSFNFSPEDLQPLDFTKQETKAYNDDITKNRAETQEVTINRELLERIINSGPIPNLLCRSGLRIAELIDNVEIRGDKVYVTVSKKRTNDNEAVPVFILGDTKQWIEDYNALNVRLPTATITSYQNRILNNIIPDNFPKRSSHICRAIYANYIYQFVNEGRTTIFNVIQRYLHHDGLTSAPFYAYIKLSPDVKGVLTQSSTNNTELKNMTTKQLTELMIKANIPGRSKYRTKEAKIAELMKL